MNSTISSSAGKPSAIVDDRRRALDQAAPETGYPKIIRLDNGPEFISKELDLWAFMHDVTLDFSRPGKPTDNAFIDGSTSSP